MDKDSEKTTVSIQRVDSRNFLKIGNECVEVSDYKVVSSADGATELTITIKGMSTVFDLSTSLEEPMK